MAAFKRVANVTQRIYGSSKSEAGIETFQKRTIVNIIESQRMMISIRAPNIK